MTSDTVRVEGAAKILFQAGEDLGPIRAQLSFYAPSSSQQVRTTRMSPSAPARPSRGTILLLGALTAFGAVSIDLYLPSLPAIGVSLRAEPAAVQQTMAAFFIGMALGQLLYGPLSDRYGRRPALLVGATIFVLASLFCATAASIEMLILGRFVQALGCCAGQVVTRAIVRDRYATQDSARIFSLLTLVLGVAPLLAPTAGAWLAAAISWRAIFAVLALFGLIIGSIVALKLTESRSPETAATARGENIFGGYLDLLQHRRLLGYILAGSLNGAVLFSYVASAPDLLIRSYGFTPHQFGLIFATIAVGVIGSSQVNRMLLDRYVSDHILAIASLTGTAFGVALLSAAVTGIGGQWSVLALLFAVLTSYGFMAANTLAGALAVDPLRAGSTSALVGASSFGCGALAALLIGLFHDGSAVPMAAIMAVALTGSAAALFGLALRPQAVRA